MKRNLILGVVFLLMLQFHSFSQNVGINSDGTNPDNSAMLHVKSDNKGMLIPQIALTGINDVTTIPTPATSLLVFNTTNASGLTTGYYYNSGTSGAPVWTKLATGVADGSETKVTGGNNVTVTGTGTSGNPYAINIFASVTQVQRDALTASTGLMIYNTTTNKPNYYNGTEWMNFDGTTAINITIGMSFRGGKVAYIYQSGDPGYVDGQIHGIIAAVNDQSLAMQWYNGYFTTTGATGQILGTGSSNTTKIITNQGIGNYAAKLCKNYNGGGYTDWFLPCQDELKKLYLNKVAIGGFETYASSYYWSSSEGASSNLGAWAQNFSDGSIYGPMKDYAGHVRAIRVF